MVIYDRDKADIRCNIHNLFPDAWRPSRARCPSRAPCPSRALWPSRARCQSRARCPSRAASAPITHNVRSNPRLLFLFLSAASCFAHVRQTRPLKCYADMGAESVEQLTRQYFLCHFRARSIKQPRSPIHANARRSAWIQTTELQI